MIQININDISNKVRATLLTGLNTALTGAISATDTVLEAFGKLQNQINGKENTLGFTPENVANKDTSTSLGTSNTLYPTQNAVKSYIDTGLSGKENTITTLPISKGGTNSGTALANNRVMRSSGGAIVEAAAITANRALVSDANGIPVASTVTNTTLGFLDATSSVQTQLNQALKSGTIFSTAQDSPHTGNTNEAILYVSNAIPSGTFQIDDAFVYVIRMLKSGTAGAMSYRAYLSPNPNLAGAVQLSQHDPAATQVSNGMRRTLFVQNLNGLKIYASATTNITNDIGATTAASTTATISLTQTLYFIITAQLVNSADTAILSGAYLERKRA
jgi:hypothetical protein